MLHLLTAASIGLAILLSWVGWGSLLNALVVRDRRLDWGQRAAWGVAVLVLLGGVLELLSVISRGLVIGLIVVGVVLWLGAWLWRRPWRGLAERWSWIRAHKVAVVLTLIAVAVIGARALTLVQTRYFNPHDDFHGYIVFPTRMLEAGGTGPDPFSHRRLVSGLGGKYFLDTFSLGTGSLSSLHLIDGALGLVLVAGVLHGGLRRRGAPPLAAPLILLLLAVLPPPMVNMSALMLGTALLLSLLRTLDDARLGQERPWAGMVMIAIVAAALCTLKNTFVVPTALVLAVSYAVHVFASERRGRALLEGVGCALLTGVLLLPWMLSLHRASGTLLYPLLGRGTDGTQYGIATGAEAFDSMEAKLRLLGVAVTQPMFLALAVVSAIVFPARRRGWLSGRGATVALALGCAIAAIVIVLVTTATGETLHWGANRYCFPILLAAVLGVMLAGLSRPDGAGAKDAPVRWRPIALACVGLALLVAYRGDMEAAYRRSADGLEAGMMEPPPPPTRSIRAGQAAVPEGEPILARLDFPFVMDFTRNPVFVIDHPGMASPAPGLPVFQGPDAVAEYLLGQDIRFVMYTYPTAANYSRSDYGDRLSETTHPLRRTIARHVFDFNETLGRLIRSRRVVWADDQTVVIDLAYPPNQR